MPDTPWPELKQFLTDQAHPYLPDGTWLLAGLSSGPPYTHTFDPYPSEWVNCPDCEGAGGDLVDDEWVDCPSCGGEEGWFSQPEQPPSYTITELP